MSGPEPLAIDVSEVDPKIIAWRQSQFRRYGFQPRIADALGFTQVDLWEAKNLLAKGCSHATLLRILVGRTRTGEEDKEHSLKWFLSETADHEKFAKDLADIKE